MMNTKLMSARGEATEARARSPLQQKGRVAVVGLGYVGLPLAIAIDHHGYEVIGYDIDPAKITMVRERTSDVLSTSETEMLKKSRIRAGVHPHILARADVYVICVPTPVNENKEPNLTPLKSAAETVGGALTKGALVVVESTVNPGVCDDVVIPALESASGLTVGRDFSFAHCPERINPGDPNYGVHNIPRVIGASDPHSLTVAREFYQSVIDAEIFPMESLREAEAVKMVENTYRDINIAFVNELAMSFERAGIDTVNVIRGASTKPFAFMAHYPSCGVGGHCIPVDPYYLIQFGKQNGFTHRLLKTARSINTLMPHYTVTLLERAFQKQQWLLKERTVTVLGVAYKRDISDMRESPAFDIIADLRKAGATVHVYDPHVPERSTVPSLEKALEVSDAVVIATDHAEFCTLQPEDLLRHKIKIIIDGKNCLSKHDFKAAGISYHGIGR